MLGFSRLIKKILQTKNYNLGGAPTAEEPGAMATLDPLNPALLLTSSSLYLIALNSRKLLNISIETTDQLLFLSVGLTHQL